MGVMSFDVDVVEMNCVKEDILDWYGLYDKFKKVVVRF